MGGEVYFTKELDHKNPKYTIVFTAEQEDIEVESHFDNPTDIKDVNRRLKKGDMAAFFSVKVVVKLKGTDIEGVNYLGCCSYKKLRRVY